MTEHQWDQTCDVLVVGSGAAGMTAAIVAADFHADVVLIEKAAQFGGCSATSGAVMWVPASHLAAEAGEPDDPEDAYTYIKTVGGDAAPDELVRTYIDKCDEMLRYMIEHSEVRYKPIPYPDYQPDKPGGKMGYRNHDCVPFDGRKLGKSLEELEPPHPSNMLFGRFVWDTADASTLVSRKKGWMGVMARTFWRYYSDVGQRIKSSRSRYLTGGNALMARLKVSLDRRGIAVRLKTRLVDLVQENGKVVGAIVESGGQKRAIRAEKGVVLAAGGFERSAELRAKYLDGSPDPDKSASIASNTGDALVAGMAVGGGTRQLDSAWRTPTLSVPGEDRARGLFVERSLPGCIMVNQAGKRFMNEAGDYHTVTQAMIDADRPGAETSPAYIVFDANYKWSYPMGPVMPIMPDWMHSSNVRQILIKADSLDELAGKIGVDPGSLKQTIDHFNDMARKGEDEDFHRGATVYQRLFGDPKSKGNPTLGPIAKAPFYAMAVYQGDIGTNGGLEIDSHGRVMDEDGKPIPGLYAAGNTAASPFGRSYPGGGVTIGSAMTFGYQAARHAMGVN